MNERLRAIKRSYYHGEKLSIYLVYFNCWD
jgi:hypothetical protein